MYGRQLVLEINTCTLWRLVCSLDTVNRCSVQYGRVFPCQTLVIHDACAGEVRIIVRGATA